MPGWWICLTALLIFSDAPAVDAEPPENSCPVTTAPNPAFVPPPSYDNNIQPPQFWVGTESLWTLVHPGPWKLGHNNGVKLPYFRKGYDYLKDTAPRLVVVGRRLDAKAPLIWSDGSTGGFLKGKDLGGMFMLTGIDIPTAGCWEISAHFYGSPPVSTVSYVVEVVP